ncbi:MAG: MBL fold metallo-hydrolase [Deltaproteobacteria bacterium]|nr:MBL fold metallo-hydrolase [Deltaproteobacteria bacterium]
MDGIIIDPGDDGDRIMEIVQKNGVKPIGIYNTHAHFDHIGAVALLKKQLTIPFALHRGDEALAAGASTQGRMFGLHLPMTPPDVDIWLDDGTTIEVGSVSGKVIHTPGHTQGGVCFLFDNLLFTGDTLFAGSVGRSDLPGGDSRQLIDSIQNRLLCLDNAVRVFPGHGPQTSIGREKKYNPFINYGG